jgi:hypothetical protein
MFKEIERAFGKFFTTQRLIVLIIFIILAWGLFSYAGSKFTVNDSMTVADAQFAPGLRVQPSHSEPNTHSVAGEAVSSVPTPKNGYSMQPVANPGDLLPVDQNGEWSALNPNSMTKGDVLMPDLLQAGYHIGLDTIGQTLRNPNLQLRSDPLIQKVDIGPWNQSTIEPDVGRVPLEIGQ